VNVTILTPDSVGSTLLQRVLTVQMNISDFDRPVINLHELTNGLESVWNPDFQAMVLHKPQKFNNPYSQKLSEVVNLLSNHDHYKVARTAHYHIIRREDSIEEQKNFYEYLNQNSFIISARRKNLLEYGISWCMRNIFKRVNFFSHHEKITTMMACFRDPVVIDVEAMIKHLYHYRAYLRWSETNFDIGSYYYYETHASDIENYCLNLPIFATRKKSTWSDAFDISFQNYNKCHRSYSDIGTLALGSSSELKQLSWDGPPESREVTDRILDNLPETTQEFVNHYRQRYDATQSNLARMVNLGILPTEMPIKKLTFAEKRFVVKNFDDCVKAYNDWIAKFPDLGEPMTEDLLALSHDKDQATWTT
jgi:hypothetical protein